MRQAHLLPLPAQVHLVGETQLHVVGQCLALGGLGRLAWRWQTWNGHPGFDPFGFRVGADLDVDLAVPVDSRFVDQSDPLRFVGTE